VVAADNPIASDVGARVLAEGGNAVDAAAATVLTLGVVNPTSSGVGGGGFALVYVAAEKRTYVVDFRETAPAALTPDRFVRDGKLDPGLSRSGGLAIGVPGEIAGLAYLVEHFGRHSLRRAVLPAEKLAREGFRVEWFLARAAGLVVGRMAADPAAASAATALRAWLAPDGKTLAWGDRATNPELARTLRRVARDGADGFYRGPTAEAMIAAIQAAGGVMTLDDLAGYKVREDKPLTAFFRGRRIDAMPLPSSGGLVILSMFGMLDALEQRGIALAKLGVGSSAALHIIAEVLKHGFANRARFLGESSPHELAEAMLDPAKLAALARRIDPKKVQPHDSYGFPSTGPKGSHEDHGTSHVCVVDAAGNAVALTTTVNGYFGSRVRDPVSGVLFNNEIDDFSLQSGVPNLFGLVQSDYNLVGPGKRPLSSMSPTLVFDGDAVIGCVGGSGGPNIISNTFQVLLNAFVFGLDARQAVETPRLHHQWTPDELDLEAEITADVRDALKKRGHTLGDGPGLTAVQLILVAPDGTRTAASDPRKGGAPAAADQLH
jgi:gamma-glutamyltranspeptidase / glutathione hydrolase